MDATGSEPRYGRAIRGEWMLGPDHLTVNHGSYGAAPRRVLAAQDAWRARMEAQPSRFMRRILPGALRAAADRLADFIGGAGADLAFVENATVGCNAVLRSLRLRAGDEIVMLSHVYGAVANTIRYVCDISGAKPVTVPVPFPRVADDALLARLSAALTPRTRIAVLDHITSRSALVLPIARMIAACHAAGVPVLVDGAHAPGQVDVDVTALDADWYVGNCHKWLMAPKGCGFLHARADRQDGIHPVTISHGYGKGFQAEFDWTGTWDPSAYLAVSDALDFHEHLGGAALRARNAALAAEAGAMLAGRFGTETAGGNAIAGAMAMIRLPVTTSTPDVQAAALGERLLDAGTDVPLHVNEGAIWMRISAQAYNELEDYRALADLVPRVISQG